MTQSILESSDPVKEVVPINADPIVDDGLKAVVVPDSFVDNIINFSEKLEEGKVSDYREAPVDYEQKNAVMLTESTTTGDKISLIIERLKSLIGEAREVIEEMTTTGMLGQGPQKKLMMVRKPRGKKKG